MWGDKFEARGLQPWSSQKQAKAIINDLQLTTASYLLYPKPIRIETLSYKGSQQKEIYVINQPNINQQFGHDRINPIRFLKKREAKNYW